jgi:hypothetical protein
MKKVYLIHMKSELDAANLAAMKYMHRFGKTLNIERLSSWLHMSSR